MKRSSSWLLISSVNSWPVCVQRRELFAANLSVQLLHLVIACSFSKESTNFIRCLQSTIIYSINWRIWNVQASLKYSPPDLPLHPLFYNFATFLSNRIELTSINYKNFFLSKKNKMKDEKCLHSTRKKFGSNRIETLSFIYIGEISQTLKFTLAFFRLFISIENKDSWKIFPRYNNIFFAQLGKNFRFLFSKKKDNLRELYSVWSIED